MCILFIPSLKQKKNEPKRADIVGLIAPVVSNLHTVWRKKKVLSSINLSSFGNHYKIVESSIDEFGPVCLRGFVNDVDED